jgi:nucleoside-diphosphate-sugar epimerase
MRAINVAATLRLFDAAARAGVDRWVQISSVATLSGTDGGGSTPVTEDGARPRDGGYALTKWEADRELAARAGRVSLLTVHPTFMLGEWDARPSSGAVLCALRMGRLRHYVDVDKNIVAAAAVAEGIWRGIDRRASGHYLLGGADVAVGDLLRQSCSRLGLDAGHLVRLDALPDRPTQGIDEAELCLAREFCSPSRCSSAKAARDLGYEPGLSLGALLEETLAYFARHKILLPRRDRGGTNRP